MQTQISNADRGRRSLDSLKEGLGDIRSRMMQTNKIVDWKKVVSIVGAIGAIALSRHFLNGKPATRRIRPRTKK